MFSVGGMRELKKHNAPRMNHSEMDGHQVGFKSYARRCAFVFGAVLVTIGLMILISYFPPAHFGWSLKAAFILVMASCNAFLVAGFLMHLISERKMVYIILGFAVAFVIGLLGLSLDAMNDFPHGTMFH